MNRTVQRSLRCLLALSAMAASSIGTARTTAHSESVGPFEVVTTQTTRRVTWFNPTGAMIDRRPSTHERYTLRHRERPLTIVIPDADGGDALIRHETLHVAWILPSNEPAVLVLVGGVNSGRSWVLVRERRGEVSMAVVAREPSSASTGVWLDAERPLRHGVIDGQPILAVTAGRIEGGRWLLLGTDTVLDVLSLRRYGLASSHDVDVSRQMALGISPDARAVARYATVRASHQPVIVIDAIGGGDSTRIPIDRRHLRYRDRADLTPAWLAHHFEWRDAQLVMRPDIAPLPYRGEWLFTQPDDDQAEYRLHHVDREIGAVLADVLVDRFHARFEAYPRPYQPRMAHAAPYGRYHVGEHIVILSHTEADEEQPSFLALYGDTNHRRHIAPLLRQLGEAMDAELAGGRHDGLFHPP